MNHRCLRKTHLQHLEVLRVSGMVFQSNLLWSFTFRFLTLHLFFTLRLHFNQLLRITIDNRLINSITSHLMNHRCLRKSHLQHLEVLRVSRMILQSHALHCRLSSRRLTNSRIGNGNGTHSRSRWSGDRRHGRCHRRQRQQVVRVVQKRWVHSILDHAFDHLLLGNIALQHMEILAELRVLATRNLVRSCFHRRSPKSTSLLIQLLGTNAVGG